MQRSAYGTLHSLFSFEFKKENASRRRTVRRGRESRHSRFRTRVSRCETPAHQAGAMAGLCDPGIALLRRPAAPKQNLPLICLAPKFPQDCQEPRAEAHGVWFLSTRKSVFLLAGSSQEIANTGFPLFQQKLKSFQKNLKDFR